MIMKRTRHSRKKLLLWSRKREGRERRIGTLPTNDRARLNTLQGRRTLQSRDVQLCDLRDRHPQPITIDSSGGEERTVLRDLYKPNWEWMSTDHDS